MTFKSMTYVMVVGSFCVSAAAQTPVPQQPTVRGGSPYDLNPACRDREVASTDPACIIHDAPGVRPPVAAPAGQPIPGNTIGVPGATTGTTGATGTPSNTTATPSNVSPTEGNKTPTEGNRTPTEGNRTPVQAPATPAQGAATQGTTAQGGATATQGSAPAAARGTR